MDKDEEKKLLKQLRKLLSKRAVSYKPKSVKPLKLGGNYKKLPPMLKPIKYPSNRNPHYQPKQNYKPKPEKTSPYPRRTTEPQIYRPKERLIYDPEVKQLLRQIEQRLADSEPDAEEMLKSLEKNPELYDKISGKLLEKMNEDSEKLEEVVNRENAESVKSSEQDLAVENKQQEADTAEEESNPHEITGYTFRDPMAGSAPKTEVDEESNPEEANQVETEDSSESSEYSEEFLRDVMQDEAEALKDIEAAGSQAEPYEAEEPLTEMPATETEPTQSNEEPESVIEQIEAEDLSLLEAELFSELIEPLEVEEQEKVEPIEAGSTS